MVNTVKKICPFRLRLVCGFFLISVFVHLGWGQTGLRYYFQKGNEAYRQENYEEALKWYQKILDMGLESAAVYYNMGNCYYKLNKIGQAILYLEKARKLAPRDADIRFNLDLARLKTIDRVEPIPQLFFITWWNRIRHFWNLRQWTTVFLIWWVAFFILLIAYQFTAGRRIARFIRGGLWAVGVGLVLCAILWWSNVQESRSVHEAVVLLPSVTAYSAPDASSVEVFVIHEGLKVRVDEQRGEWVKIILPDGKQGWIQNKSLGYI